MKYTHLTTDHGFSDLKTECRYCKRDLEQINQEKLEKGYHLTSFYSCLGESSHPEDDSIVNQDNEFVPISQVVEVAEKNCQALLKIS